MNNFSIRLTAKVRHVLGGRTCTVIGHMLSDSGDWLHLVETKVGQEVIRVWFGRAVLVEVAD